MAVQDGHARCGAMFAWQTAPHWSHTTSFSYQFHCGPSRYDVKQCLLSASAQRQSAEALRWSGPQFWTLCSRRNPWWWTWKLHVSLGFRVKLHVSLGSRAFLRNVGIHSSNYTTLHSRRHTYRCENDKFFIDMKSYCCEPPALLQSADDKMTIYK